MPRSSPFTACDDFHRAEGHLARRAAQEGGLTRRQLVGLGIGASVALYLAPSSPVQRALEAARAAAAEAPDARVLVSVFLPGGLDLLDTVVPLDQYGAYRDARGTVARPQSSPALGRTGLGMHDALTHGNRGGVKGLFDQGKLGLLPGIDYANPNLSHFSSRAFWETGLVAGGATTGWLGRWLDHYGSRDDPFQGIGLGPQLAPVLRTAGAPVAALETPRDATLVTPLAADTLPVATAAYARLGAAGSRRPGRDAVDRTVRLTKQIADEVAGFAPEAPAPSAPPTLVDELPALIGASPTVDDSAPAYPKSRLGDHLKTLAFLLARPLGVRVAAVEAPGLFDTHHAQSSTLTTLLSDVSQALAAFQLDLEQRGMADRVLLLVWSEFGRRLKANASLGTDHGAGGIAWVQGTRANAGVLTDYPRLNDLDPLQNLKVTVDFRQIYTSLLEQWLGADAAQVLPLGAQMPRVKLVR